MFFEKFNLYAKEQGLFQSDTKILLTVSGGIDSMVMMHLFCHLKIPCSVAHCNFQLRGTESDEDEAFVRQQAEINHLQIFVSKLETADYAAENHLSIQMAARELRYTWFEKLANVHHFDQIAIGHNRDDSLETFFINLGRGTGIAGLAGIASKSGNIIRPLLFASRLDIEQYAQENNISYREDSSNASDKYIRNYIRHNIIPQFQQVFPSCRDSFAKTIENLNDAHILYKEAIEEQINQTLTHDGEISYVNIPELMKSKTPKTILFEIIKQFGFPSVMTEEIYQSFQAISGKHFFSSTHKIIKDRNCLIISKKTENAVNKIYIETDCTSLTFPFHLSIQVEERLPSFTIESNPEIAQIDYEKLIFPLILRKWLPGDYFVPLGMKGMKKLSDFFIDRKLSLLEKENTWILTSNGQIVWIIGIRLDDRFKISADTRTIYRISRIQ